MERKLIMTFKDDRDSKFNLIVNSVKEDVTSEEIKAIMDTVLSTGTIMSKKGVLVEKLSAVIVDTTERDFQVK